MKRHIGACGDVDPVRREVISEFKGEPKLMNLGHHETGEVWRRCQNNVKSSKVTSVGRGLSSR